MPGGRTTETTQQRVRVDWETLRLSETTPDGYVESMQQLDEFIQRAVKSRSGEKKPVLVWIFDPEDDKTNDNLDSKMAGMLEAMGSADASEDAWSDFSRILERYVYRRRPPTENSGQESH